MTAPHGAVQLSEDAGVPLSEETTQAAQTAFHEAMMATLTAFLACKGPGRGDVAYQDALNRVRDLHWGALAEVRRLRALASVQSPVPAPTPDAVQQALKLARHECGAYRRNLEDAENATHPEIRHTAAVYRPRLAAYETIVTALESLATPQPSREGEIHPDTARLDYLAQWGSVRAGWGWCPDGGDNYGRFEWCQPGCWATTKPMPESKDGYDYEQDQYVECDIPLREAIDAAKSATPEGR